MTGKDWAKLSASERESHRKANRAYAARLRKEKKGQVNERHRAWWKRHKNKRNIERQAKYDRDWERSRRKFLRAIINVFGQPPVGASLVTELQIKRDTTKYRGPGSRKERELEKQANAILKSYKEKPQMNAAQLEQFSQDKREHQKEMPRCTGEVCWCGLCHCSRCQNKREVSAAIRQAADK